MRKLYPCVTPITSVIIAAIFAFLFNATGGFAQNSANYSPTTNSNGSLVIDKNGNAIDVSAATNLISNDFTTTNGGLLPIGFDFFFMGRYYSHYIAGNDGVVGLGISTSATSILGTSTANDLTRSTFAYPPTTTDNAPVLAAFWDDLRTSKTGATVRSVLVGTAPNRCLVIQYNANINTASTTNADPADGVFQVRIYETTGDVEYVYGKMTIGPTSGTVTASIGFSAGSTDNSFAAISSLSTYAVVTDAASEAATQTLVNSSTTGNITGLHSTADGSRRYFRFTPPAPDEPTNLTITGITSTAMTLNWTDASNELGYAVYRSTDNINFSLVATTAADVIMYNATGLTVGTTYYWRVKPFSEGAVGTGLSGNAATTAGTITGVKTVGTGGDYSNLTLAFAAINADGLGGNVDLQLITGYPAVAETYPIQSAAAYAVGSFTVRVYPTVSGLSITSANTTGTLALNNARNIIIDGRVNATGTTADLVVSNTATPGYAIQFANDATDNIVRYCIIRGVAATTTTGVVVFSTSPTGTSGNSNNIIENNEIRDGATTPNNLIYSAGTATAANSNNSVLNNKLYNFFNAGSASNAVNLSATGNTGWTISNNNIYQTANRTFTTGATHSGILVGGGNGYTISGNFIGGTNINAGGTPWTIAGSIANRFRGISLSGGTVSTSTVSNNTITNFVFTSNSSATTLGGPWTGIYILNGNVNVTGNIIGSETTNDAITLTQVTNSGSISSGIFADPSPTVLTIDNNKVGGVRYTAGTISGGFQGIAVTTASAASTVVINNNLVGSLTTANSINASTGATSTTAQVVRGIFNSSSATISITNNTIANLNNSYLPSSANTSNHITGISSTGGINTITGNTIRNLSIAANGTGTGAAASLIGLSLTSTVAGTTLDQNTIHSLSQSHASAATHLVGMYYSGATTGTNVIDRNFIHSLSLNSTSATATMIGINVAGGVSTFQNNMVRIGINAAGSAVTTGNIVVGIDKGTTSANNLYHNSVYIGGAGVSSSAANTFAFRRTSTGADIVQNNIFVNQRSNAAGTAKHYAIGLNAVTTLTSSNNVYYGTGTGFVFGYVGSPGTTDYANLSAFKTATGTDGGSAFGDPQFITPTGTSTTVDLHIHATNPSPVEGQGVAVAGVTTDFDAQVRSGLTPVDIGADAGNFVELDLSTPTIIYTLLSNTACTSDRTITATITDGSDVNVTAGTKPRLYYRRTTDANTYNDNTSGTDGWKYVEASNATSPFSFTINVSLLNGGTGLAAGQSLQYFIVAQDLAPVPNVGINAGTFATTPASVALTAANFPVTSTNSYNVTNVFANANVTIGASGADYTSLTGAGGFFAAVNAAGAIATDVTVTILDPTVAETGVNALNAVAYGCVGTNSITIKPATGVNATLTGSLASNGLIRLNGADNVIIDGSNNGSTSRNLTITNTNTTTPTAILVSSIGAGTGATNITIRNTIINTSATSTAYGISVGSTPLASGADNDDLTIQNNLITGVSVGIYANGTASTSTGGNDNLLISGNTVTVNTTTTPALGIRVGNSINSSVIGNTVDVYTTGSTAPVGISLETGFVSSSVTRNLIARVFTEGTGGYGGRGITVGTGTATSNLLIANNVIYGVNGASNWTSFGNSSSMGIAIGTIGNSSTLTTVAGGIDLYHNSVNMYGTHSYTSATITAALYAGSAATDLDVRNNAFVNSLNNITTAGSKNYSVYSAAAASAFTNIDNNLYFGLNSTNSTFNVGFLTSDRADLTAWKTATSQDVNSLSSDPLFNANNNLIPQPGSPLVAAGANVGISTDYTGALRGTPPTIGAYESTLDLAAPVITYTPLAGACNTTDRQLSATITDGGGVATGVNAPRIYFRKNSGTWFSQAGTPGAGSTWDFTITNATMGGVVPGDMITYYVIAQDASGNITSNPVGANATDVNTVSVHPPSPNNYIVSQTLAGTYTVGSGGNIATLTHAAAMYNAGCPLGGAVTFSLINEDYTTATEIFPINFLTNTNASAVNTLTIKPAATVTPTITGNTSPLLRFKGTDFVTIDGSNTVGGITKDLTLQNTSTVSGSSVVWIGSLGAGAGATNITIKNSNIVGGTVGSSTLSTFGIVALDDAGAANGADNNDLTIQNNTISNVTFGIQSSGVPTTGLNTNTVITGNTIGSATVANSIGRTGIVVSNSNGILISNNTIFNVQGNGTVGGNNVYGIHVLSGISGGTIDANNIYSVKYTGTSGYGGKGIELNGTGATANLTLRNNMISDIGGDSWTAGHADAVIGINLTGTNGAINIMNNSVNMNSGTYAGHASATFSAALNIGSASTALDIRNNIFSTNLVHATVPTAKTYAIYSAAANTAFTSIDYNDYYVSGSQGVLGYIASTDQTTLAALATAFTGNTNSLNVAPYFVSVTDAHLVPDANCALSNKGVFLPGVPFDIDGEARNATPDMGADEFTNTFNLAITNPASVCTGSTVDLTAATVTTGSTSGGALSYWTDAAATSALASPAAVGTAGTYYIKLDKGTCSEIEAVTVTVDPTTVGGTASADQTICSGNPPADLTLAGQTGNVVKWQKSVDLAFTTPVDIAASASATLTSAAIGNLTATTYFRAVVKSGACSEANSSVVTVTVDPVSVGGTASSDQSICSGSAPADITLSGNTGTIVKWQRSTTSNFTAGVTDINVTASTLNGATDIGTLTATTYFRAVVKSGVCSEANSTIVTVTVSPATVGGTASSDQTICSGSAPADITLAGNVGAVVKWEMSPTAGFAIVSDINVASTTLTGAAIGTLTQTRYIRAVVQSGVCAPATSTVVVITVDPASVGGTASSDQTLCSGSAPANITLAGNTGNIVRWERSTTSGFNAGTVTNINVTSSTLNGATDIGTLTATTYIRAVVKSGVCNEAVSSVVTITVDPASFGGAASANQTICSGTAPANITLSGHTGSVVKWQRISSAPFSTPVDIANTTTTLTSAEMGALTETTYFRAVVKSGVCSETFSSAVTITVSPATVAGSVAGGQTICIGNAPSNDLTLSGHTGNVVKWQKSTDVAFTAPVDIASTATTLTSAVIGGVNENTYFRAVVQSPGCAALNTNAVLISVNTTVNNATALAGVVGGSQVCANYSVSTSTNFLNNCDLIASVVPAGASPVSGNVNVCVKIDGSVQIAPTGEPYVQRHFDITPASNAATATSTITLYFKQSEFDAFNLNRGFRPALPTNAGDAAGIANLRITQYNGNGTAPGNYSGTALQLNPADASITYNAAAGRWSVTFDATGSGGFYVHTGQFVLPVSLVEFKGEQSGDINKLSWKTATEINNRGFELERSADGKNFSSLGFTASKAENGNSTVALNYAYNDNAPLQGSNYYRLKQIDRDGKITYSHTILLSRKVADITLTRVYPNPTDRMLNLVITSPKAERVTIIITDLTGKVLLQQPTQLVSGENQQKLDVLHLAAGSYFIKAVCANGCETTVHKFIKY